MFICTGVVVRCGSVDGYNGSYRQDDRQETVVVEAESIELLIEAMASELVAHKANDSPTKAHLSGATLGRWSEDTYYVIEWGKIYQVVGEGADVPGHFPTCTVRWAAYLEVLRQKEEAAAAEKVNASIKAAAAAEQKERAEYEKLKAKFGG